MRPKAGLSLLEGLLSVTLMATIIAMMASLLERNRRIFASSDAKLLRSEEVRGVQSLLWREVRSACRWTTPAVGENASQTRVDFRRPNLLLNSARFPSPPTPPITGWSPPPAFLLDDDNETVRCEFFCATQGLCRIETIGSITTTTVLSPHIQGLSCQRQGSFIWIELSALYGSVLQTSQLRVPLTLRRAWQP